MNAAVRIERAQRVIDALDVELSAWLDALKARDVRGHHWSHHAVLTRLRVQTTELSRRALPPSDAAPPAVHRACRAAEAKAAAVRGVWSRFRPMLEPATADRPLLAAAAELIWSCLGGLKGTPPVPVLAPQATPVAFPAELFPGRADANLRPLLAVLDQLVLPFVRLPISTQPWELLPLAHEVGHHLQHALGPDRSLVAEVSEGLEVATDDEDWGRWGEEAFADAYAVWTLGPWAIEALADHVFDTPAAMATGDRRYPPANTRLSLMAAVWQAMPQRAGWAWAAADHLGPVEALPDEDLSAVAGLLLETLNGLALPPANRVDIERLHPAGKVHGRWVKGLLGEVPLPIPADPDPVDARAAACAVRTAFQRLPPPGDPRRAGQLDDLAARAREAVAACSPDGTRAPVAVPDFTAALEAVDG